MQMANIYEKRTVSDFSNKFYSHEGNSGQWLMKEGEKLQNQGEKTEDKAKTTYANALNVDWQNSMNSLINNPKYSADPKALQEEAKKLTDKMSSEIVDDDVKVDFLVNANLKSQTYANAAYKNQVRIQNERARSSTFDNIYASMDMTGISALNVLSGDGSEDDVVNYLSSRKTALALIDKRDSDGTYMFTDEQRLKMKNDFDKNVLKSFKVAYDNADEKQQDAFYDKIMKGGSFQVTTKDGVIDINQNQVLTPNMMTDIKNYVRDAKYKRLAAKEKEYKYNKTVGIAEYMKNPTKSGLEQLKQEFPDLDDKTLDKLENAYSGSPNYMAETQAEALSMALDKIGEIATKEKLMPDGTPDYNYQFEKLVEANDFINRQSTGKDAQLGYDDVQMLREKAAQVMIDEEERKLRMEVDRTSKDFMREMSFSQLVGAGEGMAYVAPKLGGIDIPLARMTAKNTIQLAERALSDKTVPPEERVENAKRIYNAGKEMLIRIRNPEIGDKKVGDTYTVNGVTYEIVSFDNYDVQVRIVK